MAPNCFCARQSPPDGHQQQPKKKSEEEETENGGVPETPHETLFLGTKTEGGEDLLRLACDPLVVVPGGAEGVSLMIHTTHPHGLCLCASRSLKEFHAASLRVCLNRHYGTARRSIRMGSASPLAAA